MDRGYIHLYHGNGKGKTTAALGLALRASGCGKNVVFVQFLKDWKCGELNQLRLLPNITVLRGESLGGKFTCDMTEEELAAAKSAHDRILNEALKLQQRGQCDLLVLDEGMDAYCLGLLDNALFEGLFTDKPAPLELVVTGHNPDPRFLEMADYVTEMVKRRHPYDLGVSARRGIEF